MLINRRNFLKTCGASVIALGAVANIMESIPIEEGNASLPGSTGWYPYDLCSPRGYGENSLGAPGEMWREMLSPEGYY